MKTAETIRSDDTRKETKTSADDHLSRKVLSSVNGSEDRTMRILRVAG